jgi:hypothetical protein
VLIQQVDAFHVQPPQRVLDGGADVLRSAVQSARAAAVEAEPELGGDHHLVPHGRESLADELFVDERSIDLGGVEEGYAEIDGGTDEVDAVLLGDVKTVGMAEVHASQAHRRDLQSAGAEGSGDRGGVVMVSLGLALGVPVPGGVCPGRTGRPPRAASTAVRPGRSCRPTHHR